MILAVDHGFDQSHNTFEYNKVSFSNTFVWFSFLLHFQQYLLFILIRLLILQNIHCFLDITH